MSRYPWTVIYGGELTYVSDDESNLHKFNMRGEGKRWETPGVHAWVTKEADKILLNVPPMLRNKPALVHSKKQREAAKLQARQSPQCPAKGEWMKLHHGPIFAQMIHDYRIIFNELGTSWKGDMLASRLWEILTGQRKGVEHVRGKGNRLIYLTVLGILVTGDKRKLARHLFSLSMDEACAMNNYLYDPELEAFFNIKTGVDGRGEVLHALLFRDQHWLPGTEAQDAENDDGTKKTSIKQYKGPAIGTRMGASGYNKSPLSRVLEDASTMGKWPIPGDTRYQTGITKEMIEANRSQLDQLFQDPFNGSVKTFEQHLNDEYQKSEMALGTHYVCFYTNHELRARRLEDTEAVGATKNDFQARPKDLSVSEDLTDVAAE